MQDAYNLCWKLAAVVKGSAGNALLDTYEQERRPVAQHIVRTAFTGWENNRDVSVAVGFSPGNTAEQNWKNIRTVWQDGPVGNETRRRLADSLLGVLPNFNSLTVGFGYTYEVGALVPDGTPGSSPDPLAPFRASTRPGCSLPDTSVDTLLGRVALGDLVGRGRWVLIAGERGQLWRDAAARIAAERHLPVDAFVVGGSAGDVLDLRGAWARACEHGPEGAVLVRPDRFVAWRAAEGTDDPYTVLCSVFDDLLVRRPAPAHA